MRFSRLFFKELSIHFMIFAKMNTLRQKLIYMGHIDSVFTKSFLPVLSGLNDFQLVCVFINESQRNIWPKYPGYFLRVIIFLQKFFKGLNQTFMSFYWKIFCYPKSVDIYFFKSVEDVDLKSLANDFDFLLTAGIQSKLSDDFVNQFKKRAFNFHYSLLPRYRGTFPVFWQKCQGDKNFGYTFHLISNKMDSGEIIIQEKLRLNDQLPDAVICDLLTRHAAFQLPRLFEEGLTPILQNETEASIYTLDAFEKYVNVTFQADWISRVRQSKRWILDQKYVVHTSDMKCNCMSDGLFIKGMSICLCLDGKCLEMKRINYLPAVFYFWPLKQLFAKQ